MGRQKSIGVLGYYGDLNLGDELILKVMLELLSKHRVVVFGEKPENIMRLHGVEEAHHYDSLLDKIGELDMILYGGGGVLHRRYVRKVIPDDLITSTDIPIMVFAAGIPFVDWCEGIEPFLDRCRLITLREPSSLPYLRTLTSSPVMFLPDAGFSIRNQGLQRTPGKVTVNIRRIPRNYLRDLPDDTDAILVRELQSIIAHFEREGRPYTVLGFSPADEEWVGEYGGRVVGYEEAVQEIGTSELVIGTRLHAGIIAATQGTPALMLDYQRKVRNLADMFPRSIKCVPIAGLDLVKEWSGFKPAKYNAVVLDDLRNAINRFVESYIDDDGPPSTEADGATRDTFALDLEEWRTNLRSRVKTLQERLAEVEQEAADKLSRTRREAIESQRRATEKIARVQDRAAKREAGLQKRIAGQQEDLDKFRRREQRLTALIQETRDQVQTLGSRVQRLRRTLYPHRYVVYLVGALWRRMVRAVAAPFKGARR